MVVHNYNALIEKFDRTLDEMQRLETFNGGWAAMWQSESLQARLLKHIAEGKDAGMRYWPELFSRLHRAVSTWGTMRSDSPDPRISNIIAEVEAL